MGGETMETENLDYFKIGQRIRKYRKAYNLSQEQLADKVDISTTHMSHVETGNTKLSLAVLVKIANVLSIQTDALLFDTPQVNRTAMTNEMIDILGSCEPHEIKIMIDMVKSLKIALDKHNK